MIKTSSKRRSVKICDDFVLRRVEIVWKDNYDEEQEENI